MLPFLLMLPDYAYIPSYASFPSYSSFPSYASYAAGLPSLAAFGARTEVTHCTNVALAESELVTDDDVWLKAPSVRGSSPA